MTDRVIIQNRGCGSGCLPMLVAATVIYGIVEGAKWVWAHPLVLAGVVALVVGVLWLGISGMREERKAKDPQPESQGSHAREGSVQNRDTPQA